MPEQKHGLKMATATKSDIKNLLLLYNVLENVVAYNGTCKKDFDHFEKEEKKSLNRIFDQNSEVDYEYLATYLHQLTFGFHRVVMGFEVLFNNCADPDLGHLEFNKDIKEAFHVWNELEKELKQGNKVIITPDSDLGQLIIGKSKGEEVSND